MTQLNTTSTADEDRFAEIVQIIELTRRQTVLGINSALVKLYFQLGAIISRRVAAAEWGDGVMTQLAAYIARTQRVLRGFTRANPFRMRQFYEAYAHDQKVSALPRQLPWTHNLIILSQSKWPEEREFYLRMEIQERWSSRTLERQFKAALFERVVMNPAKVSSVVFQPHPAALDVFRDA